MSAPASDTAAAVLDNVRNQYAKLCGIQHYSLQDLFCPDHFRLDTWCRHLHTHPQAEELSAAAESFGLQYGIWRDDTRHHISRAFFLYPDADPLHMLNMMKILTVDFYLNDVMRREVFPQLSASRQRDAARILRRVGKYDPSLTIPDRVLPVEFANTIVLRDFRDTSPKAWFNRLHQLYTKHVSVPRRSYNSSCPTIEEYIEQRIHSAGMHHIVMWVEYAHGEYLDWSWLTDAGLDEDFRKLHYTVAAFGALSNDLFSFEREVIHNGSDANLMMAVALNGKAYTLTNIIRQSTTIVRSYLEEYLRLTVTCRKRVQVYGMLFPKKAALLERHFAGLERCMQGCWAWQVYNPCYKSPGSIWLETALQSTVNIMG